MKKIYLALFAVLAAFSADAQRSCDLVVSGGVVGTSITIDASAKTPTYIDIGIKNLGPDTLKLTDTIFLRYSLLGTGNFYLNPVKIDPGASISLKDTNFYNSGPADGSYSFCDSIWLKSTVAAPAVDPVISNNKVCQTLTVINKKTSISENMIEGKLLTVYPNPAANQLSFDLNIPANEKAIATIMDATGRVLLTKELNSNSQKHDFDVSTLSTGLYMLRLNVGESATLTRFNVQK